MDFGARGPGFNPMTQASFFFLQAMSLLIATQNKNLVYRVFQLQAKNVLAPSVEE
jgi:hypothetical protein